MAWKTQTLIVLTTLFMSQWTAYSDKEFAVYWGQNTNDGDLSFTCDTKLYHTVILGFLTEFGGGKIPTLSFSNGHCNGDDCTNLETDIKYCQDSGVQVFLSLGGPSGSYSLASNDDADELATHLFYHYLSGESSGKLGTVALNGIDFRFGSSGTINPASVTQLAKQLISYKTTGKQNFTLSAATQCVVPDPNLDTAVKAGVFDQVSVRFYNNSNCLFSSHNQTLFRNGWSRWTSLVNSTNKNATVLLDLAADAGVYGYISPLNVIDQVFPFVKYNSSNYGGVVIWDRGDDIINEYSSQIREFSSLFSRLAAALSEAISYSVSTAMRRFTPRRLKNNIDYI